MVLSGGIVKYVRIEKVSPGLLYLLLIKPSSRLKWSKMHLNSSLIASWGSNTEQTQAQSESQPNQN